MSYSQKILLFVGLIVLAVGIPLTLILIRTEQVTRTKASDADVEFSFSPTTGEYQVGQTFDVIMNMDTGTYQVAAMDLRLTYDRNILELVSVNDTNSSFKNVLSNTPDGSGTFRYFGTQYNQTVTGDTVFIAILTFKALTAGQTTVGFSSIDVGEVGTESNVIPSLFTPAMFNIIPIPSPTLTPSPTPLPSITPTPTLIPTSTPTPIPTNTPIPTPTSTPLPTPTPIDLCAIQYPKPDGCDCFLGAECQSGYCTSNGAGRYLCQVRPTATPTRTPTPSNTPTATPTPYQLSCDPIADGVPDVRDYNRFVAELRDDLTSLTSDCNNNGEIDVYDYTIWLGILRQYNQIAGTQ